MLKTNYRAILVAALAGFLMSSLYYSPFLLGNLWRAVEPGSAVGTPPSVVLVLGEMLRTLVIAFIVARVIGLLSCTDWKSVVRLALWLWLGFSGMMWLGAIMWEKTSWQVAAIHADDWLLKTILIATIVAVWPSKDQEQSGVSSQPPATRQGMTC